MCTSIPVRIEDETGKFSPADLDELRNFITNELLSTQEELEWLDVIRIRNLEFGPFGYWTARFHFNPDNPDEIDSIAAVIVLNYFYLKTLKQLKKTLAHEYGHHWTLTYLAVNQGIVDYMKQRIPVEYYQLRGLNEQDYAHDYSKGWCNCDKEVIAEDYRVLFAPSPHNQEHRMVNQLDPPSDEIREYIRKLAEYEFD
ncbi:MAG: hypothetical protein F6K47_12115 [Symploca sp. SIO2E6]|nr:hypothetical protein [Symploca sp. SIO2E6]